MERNTRSGGFLLAASIMIGSLAGGYAHQPSLGFLAGLVVGQMLLGAVWLLDRRKR